MTYEQIALQKIGEAIQIAIKERNISINQLERDSLVSKTIIYKVLKGQNYEITSLIKIMRHLNMHLEFSLMSAKENIFKGTISNN
uniref:helix-turn-helix domain-containing protein n=1 Tax=Roseivirga sp. TaxID=1964215 RepID=UPI0040484D69